MLGARIHLALAVLILLVTGDPQAVASGWDDPSMPSARAWSEIEQAAGRFVTRETPDSAWPFEMPPHSILASSPRMVFAHYFPPLPVSIDGRPPGSDYYSVNYLRRSGEGGKFARMGGYLRDRPLPVTALSGPFWEYTDAAIEILRARRIGANGFMADLLQTQGGRYYNTVDVLFQTAEIVAPDFRIVAEPDMVAFLHQSVERLQGLLIHLASYSSLYRLPDGRILVAPFGADMRDGDFWKALIDGMARNGHPIALNPVLLDTGKMEDFRSISYGMSEWGVREPNKVERHSRETAARAGRTGQPWIMPVAPQDERPKSSFFWEAENTLLFRAMWRTAITQKAAGVQLITWNDYSETTEVEPSAATQFVFYDLSAYFTAMYKTGRPPRIVRDALFYTHRRQIVHEGRTAASGDKEMRRMGDTPVHNEVELLAFLTAPASIEIDMNGHVKSSQEGAGLVTLSAPAEAGRPIFRIRRGHEVVVDKASDWEIDAHPSRDDLTYAGGSSIRPFVDLGH